MTWFIEITIMNFELTSGINEGNSQHRILGLNFAVTPDFLKDNTDFIAESCTHETINTHIQRRIDD